MRYLNFILTVIAVLLAWQCVRDTSTPAMAQIGNSSPIPVKVVNLDINAVPVSVQYVSPLCTALPVKGAGYGNPSVPVVIKDK